MSSALTRKRKRGNAEGGEGTLKEGSRSLLSGEEADQRDNGGGGEVALKKGPWTKEEDEILVDHINKYGEGNWKAVQKNSGLARDGKSCRLRWLNNLRSGLKKGPFTAEEERIILEFHYLKGSKWAQMASLLPGRTDNEIKNFWHTRSRKRERDGLPIYPDKISSKCSLIGSQEIDDMLANESSQPDETENFNLDITDLDLKDFKFCPDMLPSYFDAKDCKLISDLVGRRSDSSHNTISTRPSKCPRVSVVPHRYLIGSSNDAVPVVIDQYRQYPMKSTPCDPILNTNLHHGYDNPSTGFHVTPNISSPQPIYGSMRLEPPSFQNLQTQQCSRNGMYLPQHPSFEPVDTPVQAPLIEPVDTLVEAPLIEPVDTPVQAPLTEPCLPVPASDFSHLIDPTVYYNSDQNLKGSSIGPLQANTDSMAPNEADISSQWNALDYLQCLALVTRQINNSFRRVRPRRNFLRWSRSEIDNPTTGFHVTPNISSSQPIYGSMRLEPPSFQNLQTQQCSRSGMYVPQHPTFESVDTPVQAPLIEPCPPVPASSNCSHLIDPTVYYSSDQNLKGSIIDSLQANTDSMAPNEADISTQWNGLDDDHDASLITCRQINFLRWIRSQRNLRWSHSEIETTQNYDIYGGALNQLPAYSSFDKEDSLNQKDLAPPDVVLDSGWH